MTDLSLDAETTALVVIDLQRGIATTPTVPHTSDNVRARSRELADAFRAR